MEDTSVASSGGTESPSTPASFAEAFAADASPASSTPASDSTTTPAAAQPGADTGTTPASEDARSPFIPRARFDEVNTRLKEAETWKTQYAWAASIPQQELMQAIDLARRASADPIQYLQQFVAELEQHPQHSQALRSLAAKALAAGRGQQTVEEPQPDLPVQLDNGQTVSLYSAQQQAKREAWLVNRLMAQMDEKYAPVVKTHESIQQERAALKAEADATHWRDGFVGELASYPGFTDHKQAIGQEVARVLAANPADPRANDPAYLEALTLRAYHKVVGPTLRASAESTVLDTLKRKAAAATSVNPGSTAATTPRAVNSFKDLPPEAWR